MANILVADDDLDVRELVSGILRAAGHDVVTCANGVDAVSSAKTREFNIALVDMRMEPMDGVDTTAGLLEVSPDMRIAIITGFATQTSTHASTMERVVAAKSLGVTRFLTKPFHKEDILGLIDKLLAPEES